MHSHNGLAIGSFNGDALIDISDKCKLELTVSGIKVTGIGSCKGIATISSSADIAISCTGAQAVAIGSLEDGEGSIYIKSGKLMMKMRSAKNSAIGAIKGNMNTRVENADISIDSEGDEITGIGDALGTGNVAIIDSAVTMKILAANPKDIGTGSGDLKIVNSTVSSLINNKVITHSNI